MFEVPESDIVPESNKRFVLQSDQGSHSTGNIIVPFAFPDLSGPSTDSETLNFCHDFRPPATVSDSKSKDRISEEVSDQRQIVKFSPKLLGSGEMYPPTPRTSKLRPNYVPFASRDGTTLSPFEQVSLARYIEYRLSRRSLFPSVSPLATVKFISQFPGQPVPLSSPDYLQFHREHIIAAHYFWHYDYNEFCTKTILNWPRILSLCTMQWWRSRPSYTRSNSIITGERLCSCLLSLGVEIVSDSFPEIAVGPPGAVSTALATALQLASFDVIIQFFSV